MKTQYSRYCFINTLHQVCNTIFHGLYTGLLAMGTDNGQQEQARQPVCLAGMRGSQEALGSHR